MRTMRWGEMKRRWPLLGAFVLAGVERLAWPWCRVDEEALDARQAELRLEAMMMTEEADS